MVIVGVIFAQGGDLGGLIEERKKNSQPFSEEQIWEAFVQVRLGLNGLET
jgi:hypothetical protein